jgi:hypothetical protein
MSKNTAFTFNIQQTLHINHQESLMLNKEVADTQKKTPKHFLRVQIMLGKLQKKHVSNLQLLQWVKIKKDVQSISSKRGRQNPQLGH